MVGAPGLDAPRQKGGREATAARRPLTKTQSPPDGIPTGRTTSLYLMRCIQEMTLPTVGIAGSVSCWVSDAGDVIPDHRAARRPRQIWMLGRLAALKVLSAIMKDVAAPASPVSNTGMAPLDRRYDHAAADGARRSLRPEEATAVGQIITMAIELPRVAT